MIKMRLLLNAEVFIGANKYSECAALAQEIINGNYGTYQIAPTYQEIFGPQNAENCKEIIFAFASAPTHRNTTESVIGLPPIQYKG